ncbi:DivIVA domain-containing protein [Dactylosporangium vinaceum]|uniref:DivIVA domain-containing protein n=1 Tax=Dactylosporangium vinaceum TaxID=53362 RepID=A0ABV5MRT0_9ACTN|nr:DivIVA domain-containing protein [Dactylosporangium vinaceum]UAC00360.1 DivIVA domain-containing protein [Dactylosporangium vinaceum]
MTSFEFSVVLRGYDPAAVDALLAPAAAALTTTDGRARAGAAAALRRANLPVVLRGFDRAQVDGAIARLVVQLEDAPGSEPDRDVPGGLSFAGAPAEFGTALRGYDPAAVDRLVQQVNRALMSGSATARAETAAAVREASFPVTFRGYARNQVDLFLQQAARELA